MSGYPVSIEGKWEDLIKNPARFAGCRVRVEVIPKKPRTKRETTRVKPVDERTARFLERVAGRWQGGGIEESLELVYRFRKADDP